MSQKRVAVGDVFAIPLGDRRFGYTQFIRNSAAQGPLLKVYDLVTSEIVSLDALRDVPPRFRPVLAGFYHEVKEGQWQFLGRLPVEEKGWPAMITGHYDSARKRVHSWYLVEDEELMPKPLGPYLPQEYRNLEFAVISPADMIAERIRTGVIPNAYWLPFEDPPI